MTERLSEDLRRLFDGELDAAEVGRVLREAAADDDARTLLNTEFRMRRTFSEHREAAVPEGFSDRVMQQVHGRMAAQGSAKRRSASSNWVTRLRTALSTPLSLRPAYALALALVLIAGTVLALSIRDGSSGEAVATSETEISDDNLLVPFVYVDAEASTVAVAGDFNDWEPTRLHRKLLDGRVVWSGLIPVPRGEHRYMFVIDGTRWESDPLAAAHRDDGFGNRNAILAL